jgi:hypothetical protein
MMNSAAKQWAGRLLVGATVMGWLGGDLAVAQGLPSMGGRNTSRSRPAMSPSAPYPAIAPSAPTGAGGIPLGSIQVYTGTLGSAQAPALGSITTCPTSGLSAAGATYPALSSVMSSGTSPSPASPSTTSPLATFPVTTSPVPAAGAASMNPALANTLTTPLGGTAPVASAFGTANAIGFCSPIVAGAATTPNLPLSTSPTGAAFSDAAIPLAGTEAGGGGLSPLVDVPPPALFSATDPVPAQ